MPSLVGKSVVVAEKELQKFTSNGIKVTFAPSAEEAEVGIVTGQSVEAGTMLLVNYSGEIIVYFGTGFSEPETPDEPITPETPEIPDEPVVDNQNEENSSGPIKVV
jgi:hypothetical protein